MPASLTARPRLEGPAPALELLTARNDLPVLRLGGRYLHSPYDPQREAQGWAQGVVGEHDQQDAEGQPLWVVFGTGLGYHLRALAGLAPGAIIALEPDERIAALPERQRLLPAGVEVFRDAAVLQQAFRTHYPLAGRARIVSLPAYRELFPRQAEEMDRLLEAARRELKSDLLTYVTYGGEWLLQSLGNLPAVLAGQPFTALRDSAGGRAAVVVSPGPSLERNIDVLAAERERFVVLAPSQSLKALVSAGIEPDLVVVVDSQDLTYHFDGCPERFHRRLVLALKCHPRVVALPAEQRYFYHMVNNKLAAEFFTWLTGSPGTMITGYSVANTAFSLACLMGCDPVVLVGQDLAFTGGRAYASQAVDGTTRVTLDERQGTLRFSDFSSKLRLAGEGDEQALARRLGQQQALVWLEGAHGERLPSNTSLAVMHSWFERQAASLTGQRRLVNATEGGAYIKGMEHLALAELAGQLPRQKRWQAPEGGAFTFDRRRLFRGLQGMVRNCGELSRRALQCRQLAENLQRQGRPRRERLEKLQAMERRLLKLLGRVPNVDALVQNHLREYRRRCREGDDDLATNLEVSGLLYRGIEQAAEKLREHLEQTLAQGEW